MTTTNTNTVTVARYSTFQAKGRDGEIKERTRPTFNVYRVPEDQAEVFVNRLNEVNTTEGVSYKVQTETKEPVTISDINDITPEFLEGKVSKMQKLTSVSKNATDAELEAMIARLQEERKSREAQEALDNQDD